MAAIGEESGFIVNPEDYPPQAPAGAWGGPTSHLDQPVMQSGTREKEVG